MTLNFATIDIARIYEQLSSDVITLFNYLNGRINKLNICRLNISYYSNCNYAQFQYPNIVTVFLGSIIDNYYFDDSGKSKRDWALTVLALTLAHELFHADQNVNAASYGRDIDYAKNVENAAEYNAEVFCMSHKQDFKKLLNFNYCFSKKIVSEFGRYDRIDSDHYYGNLILGTFRNLDVYNKFIDCLNSRNIVAVMIQQFNKIMDIVYVKVDGKLLDDPDTISKFSSMLLTVRRGIASCKYTMQIDVVDDIFPDNGEPMSIFILNVIDMEYSPFVAD